eukprot:scaffold106_cov246-Pinguiococcus_pyrenoidosus.AAC.14
MWRQLVLLLLAAPLAAGFALPRSVRSGLACRSTAKDDEMFSPDKLKEVVEAEQAAPETKEQKQGFWTWLDETTWDLFQGRKERIWAPDRRPEDERGPFDKSKSSLSWGDESKLDEQLFRPLAPSQDELKQAAVQAPIAAGRAGVRQVRPLPRLRHAAHDRPGGLQHLRPGAGGPPRLWLHGEPVPGEAGHGGGDAQRLRSGVVRAGLPAGAHLPATRVAVHAASGHGRDAAIEHVSHVAVCRPGEGGGLVQLVPWLARLRV